MTSDYVSYPQRPLTPTELLRVGAALLPFGLPFGNGFLDQEIWIAMETALPHMIVGVAASREAAHSLIDARGPEAAAADVFGPFAPPASSMAYLDETDATAHNTTQCVRATSSVGDLANLHRKHADTTRIMLRIEWKVRGDLPTSAEIEFDPHSDAIFLTRASREAFAYPRYLAMFGPAYLAALRAKLGED